MTTTSGALDGGCAEFDEYNTIVHMSLSLRNGNISRPSYEIPIPMAACVTKAQCRMSKSRKASVTVSVLGV